jgi:hypothetical protein
MRKTLSIFGVVFLLGTEPITISVEEGRLHAVLEDVAAQANARLWISPGVENRPLSFSAEGAPVKDVLSDLCEGDRCRWKVVTSIVVWDSQEPTPEWSLYPDRAKPCQP